MTTMKREWKIILVLAVPLLVALYFGRGLLQESAESVVFPVVAGCPLHLQACSVQLPQGGEVNFEMNPKQPDPNKPLQLTATFQQLQPLSGEVLFEGKEMYMGYLQYRLMPQPDAEGLVQFQGEGSLSICTRSLMSWIARLKIKLEGVTYEIPFEFETLHVDAE